jgi:hypothetical protein
VAGVASQRKFTTDSPALPPSPTAHELFRGFSFVAPDVLEQASNEYAAVHQQRRDNAVANKHKQQNIVHVCRQALDNVPAILQMKNSALYN